MVDREVPLYQARKIAQSDVVLDPSGFFVIEVGKEGIRVEYTFDQSDHFADLKWLGDKFRNAKRTSLLLMLLRPISGYDDNRNFAADFPDLPQGLDP